jgi:putative transcriptional regulator
MTRHRPPAELLLDYATGTAPAPLALLVATHLALSPESQKDVRTLEAVGGVLLDSLKPVEPDANSLAKILARIDAAPEPAPEPTSAPPRRPGSPLVPAPLAAYVPDDLDTLPWRKLIGGVFEAKLPVSDARYKAALLRVEPGCALPQHTHRGSEHILVLDGAFRDEIGHYQRGDVSSSDESVDHRPVADMAGPCLCLIITEGPARLTGFWGRFLNPFIRR